MIAKLMLALLLVLGATLASSGPRLAIAQEDQPPADTPPADEAPPADEVAPPANNADPNVPWWQWRSDADPMTRQFSGSTIYQQFWIARTAALEHPNFDTELDLTNMMDGDVLTRELAFLHTLESNGQAQKVVVQNDPIVVFRNDDDYVVYDDYVDRSYLVDARTGAPIGAGPNPEPKVVQMAFRIHRTFTAKFPGMPFWKVVDAVQLEH